MPQTQNSEKPERPLQPSYKIRVRIDDEGQMMTAADARNRDMLDHIIKKVDNGAMPTVPGVTRTSVVMGISIGLLIGVGMVLYIFWKYGA